MSVMEDDMMIEENPLTEEASPYDTQNEDVFGDNAEELSSVHEEDTGSQSISDLETYMNFPEVDESLISNQNQEDIETGTGSEVSSTEVSSLCAEVKDGIEDDTLDDLINRSTHEDHSSITFKGFDCTVGCAGNCAGSCSQSCANSCYNSCKSTFSK